MAKKALREHAPHLHTTEATFDQPKLGDVRIEEGRARNPDGSVSNEGRAHKVYVFETRPESGEHGLYWHNDNAHHYPMRHEGIARDKAGFFIDADGKRMQRFAGAEAWLPQGEHENLEAAHRAAQKHL